MKYGGSGKKDIDIDDVVNAEQKLHHHGGLVQSDNWKRITTPNLILFKTLYFDELVTTNLF
ncbi:hypothetical protein MTR_5g024095 [Medicago truncatula]|uniref:Uncharacterized protein n=1 Tax=Medicago truncatula TaxID=3880 RepID=A0A072UDT8_MEDTR|nr:hypothetical protein MTR_5g024095 [Medicago truncatula]